MATAEALAAAVFAATFFLLAAGRLGHLPLPRGPVALAGGLATWALLRISWRVVDLDVIALILALMAMAGLGEAAGLFAGLRRWLAGQPPWLALWLSLLVVAATSAVLLNDAAIVVLVPYLVPFLAGTGLAAVPVVCLFAVAANVGSLLTPFGNPQNAVLARAAGLDTVSFLTHQSLLVAAGALLLLGACRLVPTRVAVAAEPLPAVAKGRRWILLGAAVFLVLAVWQPRGLTLGMSAAVALAVAFLGSFRRLGRDAARAVWGSLDANVAALFVGLYLLTGGLAHWVPDWDTTRALDDPWTSAAVVTALSNVVGNVPAILSLLRLDEAWTVAHAHFLVTVSTLGGALLLTGSAASLLAADQARRVGVHVGFVAFLRWAVPTVAPLLLLGAWVNW